MLLLNCVLMRQGVEGNRFRYPELDGLRGLAILMVIEAHYGIVRTLLARYWGGLSEYLTPILSLGPSGVDLFFVLSGFLIGGILLDNKGASNYFRVFYTRRACRIFPLYFLFVILLLAIPYPSGLVFPADEVLLPSWTYLTFTQNIVMAKDGIVGAGLLGPTWSLAIEEQFYLVLPLLIWFVPRGKLVHLVIGLILLAMLSRLVMLSFHSPGDPATWYFLLPGRADPLSPGHIRCIDGKKPEMSRFSVFA